MAGVNKVIIVGRLGNDPEMRTMPNGDAVANISVATSEVWNDKTTGERREVTEWHRIVLFRRNAEVAGQYLRKGSQVYVEGKLKTRKWQDQNGQERYTTEIQADSLTMLGGRNDNDGGFGGGYNQTGGSGYGQSRPDNYDQPSYNHDGYSQAVKAKPVASKPAKPVPPAEPVMDIDDDIPF